MPTTELFRHSELLETHGATGLFTTRRGGVSQAPFDSLNLGYGLGDPDENVRDNLQRLLRSAHLSSPPHVSHQVHGDNIIWCSGEGKMHAAQADILLTNESDCPLAVRTADCLPILLADPDAGTAAAVHAGWRGTAARIVIKAIREMCKNGAHSGNIIASLGPCIGPCCFETGEETARQLANSCAGAKAHIRHTPGLHADLPAINLLQLQEGGVNADHIELSRMCTSCDKHAFFSYRRDGSKTGRHLAIVVLAR